MRRTRSRSALNDAAGISGPGSSHLNPRSHTPHTLTGVTAVSSSPAGGSGGSGGRGARGGGIIPCKIPQDNEVHNVRAVLAAPQNSNIGLGPERLRTARTWGGQMSLY